MQLREARRLSLTTAVAAVALAAATTTGGGHPVGPPGGGGWVGSGSAMSTTERMPKVPSVPVEGARVRGDKGTPRLSQSAYEHLDIPAEALLAYHAAAMVMADVDQGCGLSWTLLAAIGRVESDHGRYAGAQLLSDGTSSEPVRGVRLDGTGPVARIHDTDGGLLDGDRVWDRAVGPMQFLPSTWSVVAVDADGDGVRSPDDIHDAALAAAVFLCAEPGALDTAEGRRAAVFRYNPSDSYVASVLALERAYRAGEFDVPGEPVLPPPVLTAVALPPMPDLVGTSGRQGPVGDRDGGGQAAAEPVPDGADPDQDPDPGDGDPTTPESPEPPTGGPTDPPETPGSPDPSGPPEPGPTDGPDPDPSGPPDPPDSPDPPESPEPEPEPEPVAVTGVLTACGPDLAQWCLGDLVLDVGDDAFLAAPASADHDSDGAAESRSAELAGLAGTEVTVVVAPAIGPGFVVAVNGLAYDGR